MYRLGCALARGDASVGEEDAAMTWRWGACCCCEAKLDPVGDIVGFRVGGGAAARGEPGLSNSASASSAASAARCAASCFSRLGLRSGKWASAPLDVSRW
jgi:hypothetical protein